MNNIKNKIISNFNNDLLKLIILDYSNLAYSIIIEVNYYYYKHLWHCSILTLT